MLKPSCASVLQANNKRYAKESTVPRDGALFAFIAVYLLSKIIVHGTIWFGNFFT